MNSKSTNPDDYLVLCNTIKIIRKYNNEVAEERVLDVMDEVWATMTEEEKDLAVEKLREEANRNQANTSGT